MREIKDKKRGKGIIEDKREQKVEKEENGEESEFSDEGQHIKPLLPIRGREMGWGGVSKGEGGLKREGRGRQLRSI